MPRSKRLLHESACSLADEDHYIADEFVDVIEEVQFNVDGSYDYGAAGCGSCFVSDADAVIFWVAQNDASERVSLKFDVDDDADITRAELGRLICDTAEECHVPYSWNGDAGMCVILGEEDEYANLPAGTFVTKTRYSTTRRGIVVDPDVINPEYEYEVVEDAPDYGSGGDTVASFTDRDTAKRFIRNSSTGRDLDVQRINKYGLRDGKALVQWEDEDRINVEQVKNLDYEID